MGQNKRVLTGEVGRDKEMSEEAKTKFDERILHLILKVMDYISNGEMQFSGRYRAITDKIISEKLTFPTSTREYYDYFYEIILKKKTYEYVQCGTNLCLMGLAIDNDYVLEVLREYNSLREEKRVRGEEIKRDIPTRSDIFKVAEFIYKNKKDKRPLIIGMNELYTLTNYYIKVEKYKFNRESD